MEPQGRHFEVVKRYIELKNEDKLINCLEEKLKEGKEIGFGNNATIISLEDEDSDFSDFCVKKMKSKPLLVCNDIDTEANYQFKLQEGGLKTPRYVIVVKDDTGQEWFIMERIDGVSIGDAMIGLGKLPNDFNTQDFCVKLEREVKKMHSLGVLHRDLHTGNVMIDEKGNPVIIDFGTATEGDPNSEYAYEETVSKYNEKKGVYELVSGKLPDDRDQLDILKANVRSLGRKVPRFDDFGNVIGG